MNVPTAAKRHRTTRMALAATLSNVPPAALCSRRSRRNGVMPVADQIPDSAKSRAAFALAVSKIDRDVRLSDLTDAEIDALIASTRAAPPAMDREAVERVREAVYRQALEDVCNPLGYLQRMADAEGAKLSGMAYAIASDIGTIQRIAKEALSTLSADAIRHGEGEASNRVIYLLQGDNSRMAAALRACRDQFSFYASEHTAAGKSEKAATNARFAKIADDALTAIKPATPASPASDGGKA